MKRKNCADKQKLKIVINLAILFKKKIKYKNKTLIIIQFIQIIKLSHLKMSTILKIAIQYNIVVLMIVQN